MKIGRPKSEYALRTQMVGFNTTPEDAQRLDEISKRLGFKGRSTFLRCVVERLVRGGFSGASCIKLGNQLSSLYQKRLKEGHLTEQFSLWDNLKTAFEPLPPLDGPLADMEAENDLTDEEALELASQWFKSRNQPKKKGKHVHHEGVAYAKA